jgi:hypothetical protein
MEKIKMNEDYEIMFYNMLDKVKKETGNINLIQEYSKSIQKYFLTEYLIDDYDIINLETDMSEIGNNFINSNKYKLLNKILTDDELTLILSVITNEIEDFIKN